MLYIYKNLKNIQGIRSLQKDNENRWVYLSFSRVTVKGNKLPRINNEFKAVADSVENVDVCVGRHPNRVESVTLIAVAWFSDHCGLIKRNEIRCAIEKQFHREKSCNGWWIFAVCVRSRFPIPHSFVYLNVQSRSLAPHGSEKEAGDMPRWFGLKFNDNSRDAHSVSSALASSQSNELRHMHGSCNAPFRFQQKWEVGIGLVSYDNMKESFISYWNSSGRKLAIFSG